MAVRTPHRTLDGAAAVAATGTQAVAAAAVAAVAAVAAAIHSMSAAAAAIQPMPQARASLARSDRPPRARIGVAAARQPQMRTRRGTPAAPRHPPRLPSCAGAEPAQ